MWDKSIPFFTLFITDMFSFTAAFASYGQVTERPTLQSPNTTTGTTMYISVNQISG